MSGAPGFVERTVLEAGLETLRAAPRDLGTLEMIVRRPAVDLREVVAEGRLDPAEGLVGDGWKARGSSKTPDRSALPDAQLALMSARTLALLAPDRERWPLAGDQLIVDLDLSAANLPPGTFLTVGTAKLVVTALPHTGCSKFLARYGKDALLFLNSPAGRELQLRGIYARVVTPGDIRVGDAIARATS